MLVKIRNFPTSPVSKYFSHIDKNEKFSYGAPPLSSQFLIDDNLTSVLLAGPASHPIGPTPCKIRFWYIGPTEGPVLHSIVFGDASRCGAKKKDDEIRLIGSWDLGVLFWKVLPAGHSAGQVIIKKAKKHHSKNDSKS